MQLRSAADILVQAARARAMRAMLSIGATAGEAGPTEQADEPAAGQSGAPQPYEPQGCGSLLFSFGKKAGERELLHLPADC